MFANTKAFSGVPAGRGRTIPLKESPSATDKVS